MVLETKHPIPAIMNRKSDWNLWTAAEIVQKYKAYLSKILICSLLGKGYDFAMKLLTDYDSRDGTLVLYHLRPAQVEGE